MTNINLATGVGRPSITVLIADAAPLARAGIQHVLADAGGFEVVGHTATSSDTVAAVAALAPDVVSIGAIAGGSDGLDLARRLRDQFEDLGIVVLTADGADDVLLRALDSGASAFVETSAPLPEYLSALRHAAVAANAFCAQGLAAAVRRCLAAPVAEPTLLSPRERQLLGLLHDGSSVPAAAAALFVSVSTAKTYVARIYDKLGVDNRAQALLAAQRLGLLADNLATV